MSDSEQKKRAPRNRTLTLTDAERDALRPGLMSQAGDGTFAPDETCIIHGDALKWAGSLPNAFFDLLFLDPPYNLNKSFNGKKFNRVAVHDYSTWLDDVISRLNPLLKDTATIYICGDWLTSHSIFEVASRHFVVRNRITWEREKGRGAKANWKNASEDIWFCTVSETYTFNVDAVKLRRRVMAPYTDSDGVPKDWQKGDRASYRDTHPSNLWTDITIPFWSMPENTDHPTQKSEKLLAKLLLASTNEGDWILDPFLGSGTTAAAAKKLKRHCVGIELDEAYCLLAQKRLNLADTDSSIQGFVDGVFWERNTLAEQRQTESKGSSEDEPE